VLSSAKIVLAYKLLFHLLGKLILGQAIPLQTWTGPYGTRSSSLPEYLDTRHLKVLRLSALRTGLPFTVRRSPWHSFLLEVQSTPWL